MADLGSLNFSIHLKDCTEQDYEKIKKKLVEKQVKLNTKLGVKVDRKTIRESIDNALKSKVFKANVEVNKIKVPTEVKAKLRIDRTSLSDSISSALNNKKYKINIVVDKAKASDAVKQALQKAGYTYNTTPLEQQRILDIQAKMAERAALAEQKLANARMQAARASGTHNTAMKRENTAMSSQSRIAGELKNQIANVYSIYTVERFVRGLYTIGGEFQKQRIALTSILGDSTKAETIFNRIKDLAVVSPFQFKELASYAKQLSAYSIPYEELYDTTKRLADISAGVGVDMGRIILAYGQVRSAAFLRGQELRQFTEAGIPLVDELAKRFTVLENRVVSAGEVFDKISRKEVSFGMVKDVLWDLTDEGGKFYNMQEALAESLAGKWSNLQDAWDVMMADIAEGNNGVLSDSLEILTELMKHWEQFVRVLGSVAAAYGTYKAGVSLANVLTAKSIASHYSLAGAAGMATQRLAGEAAAMGMMNKQTAKMIVGVNSLKAAFASLSTFNVFTIALSALAGGVFYLHSAYTEANKLNNELNEITSKASLTAQNDIDMYKMLVNQLGHVKNSSKEYNDILQKIQSRYGSYIGNIQSESDAYEVLKNKINDVTAALKNKAAENARQQGISRIEEDYNKNIADYTQELTNKLKESGLSKGVAEAIAAAFRAKIQEALSQGLTINSDSLLNKLFEKSGINKSITTVSTNKILGIDVNEFDEIGLAAGKLSKELFALNKQTLDYNNTISNLFGYTPKKDTIEETIEGWRKSVKDFIGESKELSRFIPKEDETRENWIENVLSQYNQLIERRKELNELSKSSPFLIDKNELETVDNSIKEIKPLIDFFNLLSLSSFNKNKSTKDPIAEQWKERTDLIDKAVSSYEKWRKIEGEEAASQRVKGISEFAPIFDKSGVNLDLKDPSRAYKYIQGQLDRSKEKQEDLYISLGIKIDKAGIDSAKKEVDDALKEIEKYVSQTGEKWDLYKKLFNASGNKSLSMNIAFGGEVSFKSVVDDLRNQLSKALENTGSKFSVTDVLAMKEDDVKKQFGEGVILKLYQSINEESKKMRSESLENLLGMIEDYKDYAQKIKDIERNLQKDLADIENQRGQLGEEATDRLIAQRKKKASEDAASTKFEQFKSSEDWAKTFDDLDRLSSATLSRLIKNLEEFKNTTGQNLKVNEFKELVNVLKKLRDESESRNPFKTLSDGIREYAEATEKLKKAQKELGFIQDGGEVTTGVSETSHTETKKTDSGLSYQTKVVDKLTPKLKTLADAEKDVTDAQDKQNEASDKVRVGFGDIVDMANLLIGTLGDLGSAFDALGNDSMGDTLSTVQEVAGGLLNTAQSGATLFAGISSGNPMAIMQGATGVVSGITGIIGSIAKAHDKKLDKAIQRSQLEVKKLSNDYKNLQSVIERQLGTVTQSQSKEMIANLQKQREEVVKQAQAEADKKDPDSSKIEDYRQQYIELGEQIKHFYEDLASEQFGVDLKGWADQISEALVNAFANGEDAAKAFDDTVADIMRNVIKEMISLNVIQDSMNGLKDYLFGDKGIFTDNSAEGTNVTEQEAAGLVKKLAELKGSVSNSKKIWDYLNAAAKKAGVSLEETSASNTLSKGIQENITEDTANILASYLNSIRADVSIKRALLEKWGNEILPKYNVIAEQQLTQLRAIANNTLRSAQNTEANVALVQEVRDMLNIVIDRGGKKINI